MTRETGARHDTDHLGFSLRPHDPLIVAGHIIDAGDLLAELSYYIDLGGQVGDERFREIMGSLGDSIFLAGDAMTDAFVEERPALESAAERFARRCAEGQGPRST